MVFSTSVMSLKSKPRPLMRWISWSQKPFTLETMSFQMPVMAVRNSSFVFQRFINAATSVPMTATTATTGPDKPPSAAPSFPNTPLALPTWVMSNRVPFARELKPRSAVPTVEIVLPRTISSGPMEAASSAILMIVSLVLSSMLLSLSTKLCTADTILRMAGISKSPKEMASSSN